MTHHIAHFILAMLLTIPAMAQNTSQLPDYTVAKRESRKNLTVKEWNTDAVTKTRWLDRQTTYDEFGRKIEEIEYTQYGIKWRDTFEYGENDKIVKEVRYNDRNKPESIKKYEYNQDNRKVRQYNYAPNGRLVTTKVFEYIIE